MNKLLKKVIIGTPLEELARFILNKPKIEFDTSGGYWERRYEVGRNSGAGSYGRLAEFKAKVINEILIEKELETVIEFGCGDGNQLQLAHYKDYIGIDVSEKALQLCSQKFSSDNTKKFITAESYNEESADLALSLDVIYHLIEDEVYEKYMFDLFRAATRYVIIYSSNYSEDVLSDEHVKHRKFTDWTEVNARGFSLVREIKNAYPSDENNPDNTSFADFYIFEKRV